MSSEPKERKPCLVGPWRYGPGQGERPHHLAARVLASVSSVLGARHPENPIHTRELAEISIFSKLLLDFAGKCGVSVMFWSLDSRFRS